MKSSRTSLTATILSILIAGGDTSAHAVMKLNVPECLEKASREGLQACEDPAAVGTVTLVASEERKSPFGPNFMQNIHPTDPDFDPAGYEKKKTALQAFYDEHCHEDALRAHPGAQDDCTRAFRMLTMTEVEGSLAYRMMQGPNKAMAFGFAPALCQYWGSSEVVEAESPWTTTAKATAFPFIYPFIQVKSMTEWGWHYPLHKQMYENSSGIGAVGTGLFRVFGTLLAAATGAIFAIIGTFGLTPLAWTYAGLKWSGREGNYLEGRGNMERNPDCRAEGIF